MSAPSAPREVIATPNAPKALATYSQAIRAGDTLYCSGCLGMTLDGAMIAGGVAEQADQALKNLSAILEAGGSSLAGCLKVTIFLTTMDNYAAVNEVYAKFFPKDPPARSCFAVAGLPRNGLVEIEAVALVNQQCPPADKQQESRSRL